MKTVRVGKKNVALVSDQDLERVSGLIWWMGSDGYAFRKDKGGPSYKMHRFIIGKVEKGLEIDHINRNKLDNRRSNLRIVTHSKNMLNANVFSTSKSGIKGVSWFKRDKCWRAHLSLNYKQLHLGYFNDINDAIRARKEAEVRYV